MKYIKIVFIFFLVLSCISCASKQEKPISFVDIEGDQELTHKIVLEIADLIAQESTINTTIKLIYDFDDLLGDQLNDELKTRGFALSETDGVETTFTVNSLDATRIYIAIKMGKMLLSRIFVYEAQTGAIRPGSPLSKGEV